MEPKLVAAGGLVALVGVALSAPFAFSGPTLPTTPRGYLGWALLIGGLWLARRGATRDG